MHRTMNAAGTDPAASVLNTTEAEIRASHSHGQQWHAVDIANAVL